MLVTFKCTCDTWIRIEKGVLSIYKFLSQILKSFRNPDFQTSEKVKNFQLFKL